MTPMMPDAPEPQNRLMAGPGGAPGPAQGGNALMPQQGAQQAPAPPPPPPQEVAEAKKRLAVLLGGLRELIGKPKGELTKKDVFDGAADMIAKGAFPTPASRQQLVAELAGLPDDEPGIRKELGGLLLQASAHRDQVHQLPGAE